MPWARPRHGSLNVLLCITTEGFSAKKGEAGSRAECKACTEVLPQVQRGELEARPVAVKVCYSDCTQETMRKLLFLFLTEKLAYT